MPVTNLVFRLSYNLKVPILVHVATNDEDVNFVEDQQMVYTPRALKSDLAETKIYENPAPWGTFGRTRVQPSRGSRHTRARRLAGADRFMESDVDVLRVESPSV